MDSISPVYHPSYAKNHFQLSNDLADDGSYIWYDSENPDNITYPSNFKFSKTNNYNNDLGLKLSSIVLNNKSTMNTNMNLPATNGTFNATLVKQSTNSPPTIDLYFQGIIQSQIWFGGDYPGWVGYNTYKVKSITPNTFPNSGDLTIKYEFSDRYVESEYTYYGDSVTITSSWTTAVTTSVNANDTITYPAPTQSVLDSEEIPTITIIDWVRSGGPGGGGDQPGNTVTVRDIIAGGATGYAGTNYNIPVFVRAGSYTKIGERYNAWLISGTFYNNEGTQTFNQCAIDKNYCT